MTPSKPTLEEFAATIGDNEAGFGALETPRGRLPLVALEVRARIDGLLARTEVVQTFVNATDEPLEATYIFPLPDRAGVTSFRMEVNGRVIEGVLDERGKARATYDRAIDEGRRAAIAEEERAGVFTIRVGNLLPGETAAIRLTLAGVLPYDDGEVTFRFPLVVAQRYVPGIPLKGPNVGDGTSPDTDAAPDASRITPPVLLPGYPNPVRLVIAIELRGPGTELARCNLHSLRATEADGMTRIELDPAANTRLDRDFILRFPLGEAGNVVRSSLSFHPDGAKPYEGTFALTVVPPKRSARPRPRDIVFVLDRSGSMEGWKIVLARRALARIVDTLGIEDRFHVIAFDTSMSSHPGEGAGLVPASDRNRFRSAEFLAGVNAHGGTEMARPLLAAAKILATASRRPGIESNRVLVLITDGQIANEDQILSALRPELEGVRVFALGIDRDVNEGFLNRLANLSAGGACLLVESVGRFDATLDSIHRRIALPVLTDLQLQPEGWSLVEDTLIPGRHAALFENSPLLVLGRYQGTPGPLRLLANDTTGESWREEVSGSLRDNPAIAAAWARGQVRKLEDRYVTSADRDPEIERAVVDVSLKFGVLSRFTAYVAVDRSDVANPEGVLLRVTQPVEATPEVFATTAAGYYAPMAAMPRDVGDGFHQKLAMVRKARVSLNYDLDPVEAAPPGPAGSFSETPPISPSDTSLDSFRHADVVPVLDDSTVVDFDLIDPTGAGQVVIPGAFPPHFSSVHMVGRGGFGRIYRAVDSRRGAAVMLFALGVDRVAPLDLDAAEARVREVMRLNHPGILRILDMERVESQLFIVFEDSDFSTLLTRGRDRMAPGEAARIVLQAAEALDYAHRNGVLHGFLSAEDVHIDPNGRVRLSGFEKWQGANAEQAVFGFPQYMSSQRMLGAEPLSARDDIYALGVVLYLAVTGQVPYQGDKGSLALLEDVRRGNFPSPRKVNPKVSKLLEAICLKAMAHASSDRYPTAGAMAGDLRRFVEGQGLGILNKLRRALQIGTIPGTDQDKPDCREGFWK